MKLGMARHVVPTVTKGIEAVGEIVINRTEPSAKPNPCSFCACDSDASDEEGRDNKERLKHYVRVSDQSVKASASIRRGARSVAFGVRDFSTRQVQSATAAWKEKEISKHVIPDDGVRDTVLATGRVGAATLGAAALLTETVFESTRAIAQTSVRVASDVAHHKYGEDAGRLVQNTGDATGNVLRTITHVKMLKYQVLAQIVAKNTAKEEIAGKRGDGDREEDPGLVLKDGARNKRRLQSDGETAINAKIEVDRPRQL